MFNPNLYIWLVILCFLIIGFFIENGISFHKIQFPFLTYTMLLFYHDYFFINLSYLLDVGNIFISSSWKEIIIVVLLFAVFFRFKVRNITRKQIVIILFSAYYVVYGVLTSLIVSNGTIADAIIVGKNYIYPFLFVCALNVIPYKNFNTKKVCILFFYIVVLPNFLHGIFEYIYVHDLNNIWFYEPLSKLGNEFAEYNHFRYGIVRSNGFFVGTLSYAVTGLISFICFFILIREGGGYIKILVSLGMLYLSHSRVFWIGIFFFLVLFYYHKIIGRGKIVTKRIFSYMIISPFFVILLLPYVTSDYSAIGRIYQWEHAIDMLINYPLGQGFSSIGTNGDNRADSMIIDFIRIYGFFAIILFYYSIKLFVSCWNEIKQESNVDVISLPFLSIFTFVFIIFFQSLINVPILSFILFLIFNGQACERDKYV